MSLGKSIYKTAFALHAPLAKCLAGSVADIWYRNSLLQNYFRFGLSDIDVTVVLKSDKNVSAQVEPLNSKLQYCPLIKEINFYYPFNLKHASSLMNAFELKKDPRLNQLIQSSNDSLADQFVYLLRMYFANIHLEKFTARDQEKWNFHFSLTGLQNIPEIHSREELLTLITERFESSAEGVLKYAVDNFKKKTSLYDMFMACPDKEKLYLLLPHHFCYADIEISSPSEFSKEVCASQLSWEIWAFLTQPYMLKKDGPGKMHLQNLKKALLKMNQEKLLSIVDEIEGFN